MAERLLLFKTPPRRIVDWSSFLGASAQKLTTTFPNAALIAVEPGDILVERSRQSLRLPWWNPKRWTGPAPDVMLESETPPRDAQLVWANMALHGVTDPPALMRCWHSMLSSGGFVMFSCLGPDTVRELTSVYAHLQWPAPTIGFVDMHDLGDMLVHAGFADPVMDQERLTVHWDSAPALCRDLRLLGGNVSPDRHSGLRTPRWRASLQTALEPLRDRSGRLALTFEIVYGHAFKVEVTSHEPAETQIPLEEMRRLLHSARKTGI
ncbi:MAG: methyltransferase domain-containing protein [Burkholderiales bacterium]